MGDVVYQEYMLSPIILLHIYSWKVLKLSVFMFLQGGGTPNLWFYWVEEHMGDVVCQENMLCPIILLHIYSLKILKLSDLMFLLGGGTCG